MHMHRYEKIWLSIGMGCLILFLTIVGVNAIVTGHNPPSGQSMIDPEKVRQTEPFNKTGLRKIGENEYEMVIVASAFTYDIGNADKVIKVPKGAKVTYKVATTDVVHGFMISGTNVNMMVEPGYISELKVTHNKTGKYTIVCNEYCGAGHHMMFATLEVTEDGK